MRTAIEYDILDAVERGDVALATALQQDLEYELGVRANTAEKATSISRPPSETTQIAPATRANEGTSKALSDQTDTSDTPTPTTHSAPQVYPLPTESPRKKRSHFRPWNQRRDLPVTLFTVVDDLTTGSVRHVIWADRGRSIKQKGVQLVKPFSKLHLVMNHFKQVCLNQSEERYLTQMRTLEIHNPDGRLPLMQVGAFK